MKKTLLLTDIVSSTALTQQIGDERMSKIWIKHDETARSLLQQYKAVEADRTDGFLMLFDDVNEACQYAIKLHQGFEEISQEENIDFKTRIGIHTGEVILIETSEEHRAAGVKHIEVEGIAKPTAARVMSIAGGGQTLLSKEAFDEINKDSLKHTSHGYWRMKGVAEPVELFETGNETTLFHPPKDSDKVYRVNLVDDIWQPVKEIKHNLGTERDRFIGRKEDLHRLSELVNAPDTKLLTILGPGGTGKTRISKRFGRMWLGDYPGGVWFCDLADSKTLEGVVSAVATALNIQLSSGDPVEQLGNAIQGRNQCLIIFDNFEQITKFAGQTISRWLQMAQQAKFIVTSRNILNVRGEITMELQPLPLEKDGLLLFETRAQERKSSFNINDQNRDDVEAIIKTLDGMPLAIELAAARITVLSPSQIRERLKERFKLLTGKRDVSLRQQTLRAAIDWSWDILEEWEKSALAQCSIFEGGFTLIAAEEILDLSAFTDAPMKMDVVQELVNKSLLRSDIQPYDENEPWFGLYVSIQEYSREKLSNENAFSGSGHELEVGVKNRHMNYFSGFGSKEGINGYNTHGGVLKRKALNEQIDNLWSAIHHAVKLKNEAAATLLLKALWQVIKRKGPRQLILKIAEEVLDMIMVHQALKAEIAGLIMEYAASASDEITIKKYTELSLQLCEKFNDKHTKGYIFLALSYYNKAFGKPDEAIELSRQALLIAEETDDKFLFTRTLFTRAYALVVIHKSDLALKDLSDALAIAKQRGDLESEAAIIDSEGKLYFNRGDFKSSIDHHIKAIKKAEEADNSFFQSIITGNLAMAYQDYGNAALAKKYILSTMNRSLENGDWNTAVVAFAKFIISVLNEDNIELAAEHFDKGVLNFKQLNNKRLESIILLINALIDLKKEDFESADKHLSEAMKVELSGEIFEMALWYRALYFYHTGDHKMALESFNNIDLTKFNDLSYWVMIYADWVKTALAANKAELAKEKYNKLLAIAKPLNILPTCYIQKNIDEINVLMQDITSD